MNFTTTNHSLCRLGAAISVGVLALGLSGAVVAHGTDADHRIDHNRNHGDSDSRGGHARPIINNHYYNEGRGHHRHHSRHGHRRHGRNQHRRMHVHQRYDAPVEVVEVYQQPRRVVTRQLESRSGSSLYSSGANQINAGSLIGAAVGGLLGSQVGGGKGKLAATAAGTVGGFLLGNHVTHRVR
jgi:uncharacterized protein YcfJ